MTSPNKETLFEKAIETSDPQLLKRAIEALSMVALVERFTREDDEIQDRVLGLLNRRRSRQLLRRLPAGTAADALLRQDPERAADMLARMPIDDRVNILGEIPEEERVPLVERMPAPAREALQRALSYPDSSAGRLMVNHMIRLDPGQTVSEALARIRDYRHEVETILECYVVGDHGKLVGVVPLTTLVTSEPTDLVGTLMTTDPLRVSPDDDQEKVARLLDQYEFLAVPVVDEEDQLLGIVTHDDVVDVLVEENTEDVLQLGGIAAAELDDEPYLALDLTQVIRSRVSWLTLLFVAESMTGHVLESFQHEIELNFHLSVFIPLLIGTGGNAGGQTVTAIIRGLALGEIRREDTFRVLSREMITGGSMGLILGVIAFIWTSTWNIPLNLSLTVSLSVIAICIWANTVGSLVPIVATRLGIDPTVMSAPLIATLVDATGLFIYFSIARALLF